MAALPPPLNTVYNAMILCGVDDNANFNGETAAQRIAAEVFDDDFASCMDKTLPELDDDFKSYSSLTAQNGQIRLNPGVKKRIKAFIQWSRDQIRVGMDPATMVFPPDNTTELIRRMKTHEAYKKKASTISDAAKPSQFTSKTKWEDWNPVFKNFLRSIPGRNGVPLSYVCRADEGPTIMANIEFIDQYVNRAPLQGEAFKTDAAEVNTYIVSFIAGNSTAEAKILGNERMNNGRLDYMSLKNHYEGTGVNAIDIVKADKVLDTLYYAGEKKPHMWWEEFEKQLTLAFNAYDKKERRQVHSNEMKLRILCRKVTVDFLQHTRASINIELTREVSSIRTKRKISQLIAGSCEEPREGNAAMNEADSNADTCCLGANFIPIRMTNRTADVYPYDTSYEPLLNVPIVSGATAWTCPSTRVTYILVLNESLYYGTKLDHTLLNPNQIRHNGVDFWDNPYDKERALSIQVDRGPTISLEFVGIKLQFESKVPTNEELNNCEHIEITSSVLWEPSEVTLGQATSKRVTNEKRTVKKVGTLYNADHPYSHSTSDSFTYADPASIDSIIHQIEPSMIDIKERIIKNIQTERYEDIPARRTFISNDRHKGVTADNIAELWCIGKKKAEATLEATTQKGTRSAILPINRSNRNDRVYNLRRLDAKFATDTLYSEVKSLHDMKCAQIYSNKVGFAVCYPMTAASGQLIGQSLKDFAHDFGIPNHLTFDGAQAQVGKGTLFMKTVKQYDIKYHVSAPRRPNENPAEGSIRQLKMRWYRVMMKKKVPKRIWDYGMIWVTETGNLSVSSSRYANGRTPIEYITGETPDISEYLDFGFYDWVVYRANAGLGELSIGRWLGVSHKVGQLMSYWILTIAGRVISATTVQRLTYNEQGTDEWKDRMAEFDNRIKANLDPEVELEHRHDEEVPQWNRLSMDESDADFAEEFQKVISDESIREIDEDYSADTFDDYLSMVVGLPRGDDNALHQAKVKERVKDEDGIPIGKRNNNPLMDSRMYEVEFLDGSIEILTANIIAENLLAQVDSEGHRQLLLKEIIDHRTDGTELKKENGYFKTPQGTRRKKRTTRGWELCLEWKDGSQTWVAMKDVKNASPIELAEYAIRNGLKDEPAFAWWIGHEMRKRNHIIAKLKSKYWQRTHKYGIRVPKSVQEAYRIDEEEGNTLWRDTIEEEMKKI